MAGAGAAAYAALGGGNDVIRACVDLRGNVRIIDSGAPIVAATTRRCSPGTSRPQGATGPAGPIGLPGSRRSGGGDRAYRRRGSRRDARPSALRPGRRHRPARSGRAAGTRRAAAPARPTSRTSNDLGGGNDSGRDPKRRQRNPDPFVQLGRGDADRSHDRGAKREGQTWEFHGRQTGRRRDAEVLPGLVRTRFSRTSRSRSRC